MAKKLIPEELDALIQQFLTDGVLTDKERQVILNKAEKMGLDRDEIDLYLDAEVQKIDQATDAAVRKQKGKTCPYCGGSIPQLTDKCPHCGENITAEASEELTKILHNLEESLFKMKSNEDFKKNKAKIDSYTRKAQLYYSNNPKIQQLLSEIEIEKEKALKGHNIQTSLRWIWVIIPLALALFFFVKCENTSENIHSFGYGIIVIIFIVLSAFLWFIRVRNRD